MQSRLQFYVFAFGILNACMQAKAPNTSLKEAVLVSNVSEVPTIDCAGGERVHFTMVPPSGPLPEASGFNLPPYREVTFDSDTLRPVELEPFSADTTPKIRLDACLAADTEQLVLKQIVFIGADSQYLTVEADATVAGLESLAFDGDYSAIDITIPYGRLRFGPEPDSHFPTPAIFFIRGAQGANGRKGAVYYSGDRESGSLASSVGTVPVGLFAAGDPIGSSICQLNQTQKIVPMEFSTVKLSTVVCDGGGIGTSGGHNYKVVGAELTDSAATLPAQFRNVPVVITKEQAQTLITVREAHHNSCENMVIKLPQGTYGFTSFTGFGEDLGPCLEALPGAPKRKPQTDPNSVLYSIKYALGGTAQRGVVPCCTHFAIAPSDNEPQ